MQAKKYKINNSFISVGQGAFLEEHARGTGHIGSWNASILQRHRNLFGPFSPLSFCGPCPQLQRGPLGVLSVSQACMQVHLCAPTFLLNTHCGYRVVTSPILGFVQNCWQYQKNISANKLPFRESSSFVVFIKFDGLFMALPVILPQLTLRGFSYYPKLLEVVLKWDCSSLTVLQNHPCAFKTINAHIVSRPLTSETLGVGPGHLYFLKSLQMILLFQGTLLQNLCIRPGITVHSSRKLLGLREFE